MGILSELVIGYEKIEPVIIANVAVDKNIILVGRHGTCKTTLARELAKGYGGPHVIYDATKDDIISICGIPKTSALEEGRFEFAIGERTIWDKKLVVIDEIGRATKENQNILLEILQEKSCFGKKLEYRTLIATMNPESYAASLRLDEALLDRFYCVINVPDFYKGAPRDKISGIISMNLDQQRNAKQQDVQDWYDQIRAHYQSIKDDREVRDAVVSYASHLLEVLTGNHDRYISPRRFTMFAEEIMIIGAYHKWRKEPDYLNRGAVTALDYTLSIPLKIDPKVTRSLHTNFKHLLTVGHTESDKATRIRTELARLKDAERALFIINNLNDVAGCLKKDEATSMMGYALDHSVADPSLLLRYFRACRTIRDIQGTEEIVRRVNSAYLTAWDKGVKEFNDKLGTLKLKGSADFDLLKDIRDFLAKLHTAEAADSDEAEIDKFRKLLFEARTTLLSQQSVKDIHSLLLE